MLAFYLNFLSPLISCHCLQLCHSFVFLCKNYLPMLGRFLMSLPFFPFLWLAYDSHCHVMREHKGQSHAHLCAPCVVIMDRLTASSASRAVTTLLHTENKVTFTVCRKLLPLFPPLSVERNLPGESLKLTFQHDKTIFRIPCCSHG